ncbi:unnamed protein product [Closterium sp. NIES-65]|nr:unnamed protein product [Closterium sp. NIES-65]
MGSDVYGDDVAAADVTETNDASAENGDDEDDDALFYDADADVDDSDQDGNDCAGCGDGADGAGGGDGAGCGDGAGGGDGGDADIYQRGGRVRERESARLLWFRGRFCMGRRM